MTIVENALLNAVGAILWAEISFLQIEERCFCGRIEISQTGCAKQVQDLKCVSKSSIPQMTKPNGSIREVSHSPRALIWIWMADLDSRRSNWESMIAHRTAAI